MPPVWTGCRNCEPILLRYKRYRPVLQPIEPLPNTAANVTRRVPIFSKHGPTYRAESCEPLLQAVQDGKLRLENLVHGDYPGRSLPRTVLPGIKAVGYWDADEPQNWGLGWHQNDGIELTLLERGSLDFAVEGNCSKRRSRSAALIGQQTD